MLLMGIPERLWMHEERPEGSLQEIFVVPERRAWKKENFL